MNMAVAPHDLSALTKEQLLGETCARCGRVPLEATNIRYQDSDLIICSDRHGRICTKLPFWLTRPCPSWCDGLHHDCDSRDDRAHMSAWRGTVPLVLEQGTAVRGGLPYQPEYATLYLVQGAYERKPRIWCGKGDSTNGWHMTSTEARELAATILTAVDLAEQTRHETPSATSNQRGSATSAQIAA